MTLDQQFEAVGVKVTHHFGDREYAKETLIPAGVSLTQHSHAFAHLSILAQGHAWVHVDGKIIAYDGPACILIEADKEHSVEAITDVIWYCIHATDCKDPAQIDNELMKEGG